MPVEQIYTDCQLAVLTGEVPKDDKDPTKGTESVKVLIAVDPVSRQKVSIHIKGDEQIQGVGKAFLEQRLDTAQALVGPDGTPVDLRKEGGLVTPP